MTRPKLLQHKRRRTGQGVLAELLQESLDGVDQGGSGVDQPKTQDSSPTREAIPRVVAPSVESTEWISDRRHESESTASDSTRIGIPRKHRRRTASAQSHAAILRSAPKIARVLRFLLEKQIENGGESTSWIRKRDITDSVKDPPKNMNATLCDAMSYGLVARRETRHGRGGGSTYHVPPHLHPEIMKISGSYIASSDNDVHKSRRGTQKGSEEELTAAVEQFGLDEWGIGVNDVISLWRRKTFDGERLFSKIHDLVDSLDRIAFYLRSPQANGIREPRSWVISQLKQGIYGRPAGYRSWREREEEKRLNAAQNEAKAIKEMQEKRLDADFEIWLAQKSETERRELLSGTFFTDPNSQAAKTVLRQRFCEQIGLRDLCNDASAPE